MRAVVGSKKHPLSDAWNRHDTHELSVGRIRDETGVDVLHQGGAGVGPVALPHLDTMNDVVGSEEEDPIEPDSFQLKGRTLHGSRAGFRAVAFPEPEGVRVVSVLCGEEKGPLQIDEFKRSGTGGPRGDVLHQ